jgi:hypothetical protein
VPAYAVGRAATARKRKQLVIAVIVPTAPLSRSIDNPMVVPALDRVVVVGELALHPFQVAEPRAVRELVEHAHGEERRERLALRRSRCDALW